MYTVVDEVGKDRYWGTSLRDAFHVWSDIAKRELADRLEPDGSGNVMTDMDCGGGSQLYEHGWRKKDDYKLLYDSGCGRCWDCEPEIYDIGNPLNGYKSSVVRGGGAREE
jgi:hypothetical protein